MYISEFRTNTHKVIDLIYTRRGNRKRARVSTDRLTISLSSSYTVSCDSLDIANDTGLIFQIPSCKAKLVEVAVLRSEVLIQAYACHVYYGEG